MRRESSEAALDKAREQVRILTGLDAARGALMNGYVLAKEKRIAEAEVRVPARGRPSIRETPAFTCGSGTSWSAPGRREEARASYREAVRLDPALEGARKDLTRLGG